MTIPFFDGHNDFLLRLMKSPRPRHDLWLGTGEEGHLDLARMQEAGFVGGLFAIFVPRAALGLPRISRPLWPTRPMQCPCRPS